MKILVADIETGVINPIGDQFDILNCVICEVGIVSLDLETGEVGVVMNSVCREDRPCHRDSWVFSKSSLTIDEVMNSDPLEKSRGQLQSALSGDAPVTSWGHVFDLKILESRGYMIPLRFWDPLVVLAPLIGIPGPYGCGFKWPSVEEAHGFLRPWKPFRMAHRAAEDARVEASIIYEATLKWPELSVDWERYVLHLGLS